MIVKTLIWALTLVTVSLMASLTTLAVVGHVNISDAAGWCGFTLFIMWMILIISATD